MARISLPDANSADREAVGALSSAVGHLGVIRALALASTNVAPMLRLGGSILSEQLLDARHRELLILLAMRLDHGAYEWSQHVEIALSVGAREVEIEAIRELRLDDACFDAADQALLIFGQSVVEGGAVSDEIFQTAAGFFEPRALVESVIAIGYYMILARITETFEIEPDPVQGLSVLSSALSDSSSDERKPD